MASTMLLAAGACFADGGTTSFRKCALQPSECASAHVFRSPDWLVAKGAPGASAECSSQETLRTHGGMGRCDGAANRDICTSDKTACNVAVMFSPLAEDCNLVHDYLLSNEFANSHYGFCVSAQGVSNFYAGKGYEDHQTFCAWKFSECKGGDPESKEAWTWHNADVGSAEAVPECHCDDVRTGACVALETNEITSCAVASEVCGTDSGSAYVSVLDLEFRFNATCKLCDALEASDLVPDPGYWDGKVSPTQSPNQPPGDQGIAPPMKQNAKADDGGSGGRSVMGVGAIAGIVIGIVVGVAAIAGLAVFASKRRKRRDPSSSAGVDGNQREWE